MESRVFLCFLCFLMFSPFKVFAEGGGISIAGTRIIYPLNSKQETISINNSSKTSSFLIQSWVEDDKGSKSSDFIVSPPLYLASPGSENILRLVYTGGGNLPKDRESLFYFIGKAIPSVEKNSADSSVKIAVASKIKLFVRPVELNSKSGDAPKALSFSRQGRSIKIENDSPYYITLTNINSDGGSIEDFMISPKTSVVKSVEGKHVLTEHVNYQVINDFGGISEVYKKKIK